MQLRRLDFDRFSAKLLSSWAYGVRRRSFYDT